MHSAIGATVKSSLGILLTLAMSASLLHAATEITLRSPEIARTAGSILLLWDSPPGEKPDRYEVARDGERVTEVEKPFAIVAGLAAGRDYRFTVRARRGERVLGESPALLVATKPAGPRIDVTKRGAVGDGLHDDTAAVQAAIADCPSGGTIYFAPGVYLIARLELKSDLTLYLERGATLQFRDREEGVVAERTMEMPGPDGPVRVGFGALLLGVRTDNVAIVGEGTINGGGASWWPHADTYRPKLFEVIGGRNLLVQGVTLEDPPFWNTHPIYVDGAVFAGVKFLKRSRQRGSNGDGLDPDSCRDVLIAGCEFGNQDDSIAIKSGKLGPAQNRRQRPCENIEIQDCRFDGSLAPGSHPLGLGIGSENCGGVRHVRVRNCDFVNVASLANIKTNRERRFAVVEDVRFEDCTYTNAVFSDEPWNRAPITLDAFYYAHADEDPDRAQELTPDRPVFRDIHFRNITIENRVGRAIYLSGLAEQPLRDVSLDHITIKAQTGVFCRNVDGLVLANVDVSVAGGPAFTWGSNVKNVQGREQPPATPPPTN